MSQTTSDLWKTLWGMKNTEREFGFDIAGVWYGPEQEVQHSVDSGLYEEFGIGNATIAKLTVSLFADNIPRSATIKRYIRLKNGGQVSEWLPYGVYFTNRRSEDDGYWTVEAFDSMRKGDKVWTPEQDLEFPMPMPDAAAEFARLMGVEIDPRTTLNAAYTIDYPANDYTIRDELCFIAAAHGGNWVVTREGKLLLVPLLSFPKETDDPAENSSSLFDKHDVGLDITGFENNGRMRPISRVTLLVDDENALTAGDDTGMELLASCPHATQGMVDAILAQVRGYEYQMYSADAANIDPAAELGDGVTTSGIYSVISRMHEKGRGYNDLSAPGEAELEDEYPSEGPASREFNRKLAETRSYIYKTAEEISLVVETVNAEVEKLAEFNITVDKISSQVQSVEDEMDETIKYVSTIEQYAKSIRLNVTNGETSSSFELTAGGAVLSSGTITFKGIVTFEGLQNGTTTIDGGCIKTGTISADRIDVANLKVNTLWGTDTKVAMYAESDTIYIGGRTASETFDRLYLYGTSITLSRWSDSKAGIIIDNGISNYRLYPGYSAIYDLGTSSNYFRNVFAQSFTAISGSSSIEITGVSITATSTTPSIGTLAKPWSYGYFTNLYINGTKFDPDNLDFDVSRITYSSTVYAELNSSGAFVPRASTGYSIGSSSYPWQDGYFTNLYIDGTKFDPSSLSVYQLYRSSTNYVTLDASRRLVPHAATSSYPYSLGSSSYPWYNCYLGAGTIKLGSSGCKIGFFGTTPITRQTLSTYSQNMSYSSATDSNYLTILNNIAGILKKYGLIA